MNNKNNDNHIMQKRANFETRLNPIQAIPTFSILYAGVLRRPSLLSARSDTELLLSTSNLFSAFMMDGEPHNIELAHLLREMATNALQLANPSILHHLQPSSLFSPSNSPNISVASTVEANLGIVPSHAPGSKQTYPNTNTPLGFYLDLPQSETPLDLLQEGPQDVWGTTEIPDS
jgi:hypothetical protein